MTDKEFKRLKRKDLIEIIYELQKELQETKEELEKVRWARSKDNLISTLENAKIEIECMTEEAKNLEMKLASLRRKSKEKSMEDTSKDAEEENNNQQADI